LLPHEHTHVIRRKDLLDLFDTTPDLAGNDIDIDRYVREVEDSDVRVFWRDYGDPDPKKQGATPNDINGEGRAGGTARIQPAPRRDELCPVPVGDFRSFVKTKENRSRVWRWNFTEKAWEQADPDAIAPGQVFLVHVSAGGYSRERGWTGDSSDIPNLDHAAANATSQEAEGYDDDHESQTDVWQTIAEHTDKVCRELDAMVTLLPVEYREEAALRAAARWHDWGKAHSVFQAAVRDDGRPSDQAGVRTIAKAPEGFWQRYERKHFRHELTSALAVLQRPHADLAKLSDDDLNLVAYLIAAHHGKVRLSIRSMPNEMRPPSDKGQARRFARGVWDGDMLPSVDLGSGMTAVAVTLSLEPMELGLCETEPFVGQPSWIERALRLRDCFGPFRLAYLEAILRAADKRASATVVPPVEVNRV
jgi:CRISPR-associated endonuclease/helicase Cas3